MTKPYTDNISGASVSSTPLVDAILKKSMTDVSQSYIDTFAKDAEAYKTQAKKDFSALDWNAATSEEAKVSRAQQVADLNSRSRRIRSYLDTYKDELSPEGYESLMGYLDDFDSFSADSTRDFRKKSDEIARFASAQEYEEFLTSQKAESELYGYDLSSGEKEIAALRSQLDSLDWTSNTDRARAKALNEEIAAKEKYLEKARKAQQMQQRKQTYASLMAAEDFQSLSQYSSKAKKSATLAQWNSLSDEEQDSYFDAVSGLSQEDLLCEAVNGNFAAAVGLNNAGHEVFDGLDEIYRNTPSELLQLSGEERAVFNYLYRKQGLPAAKKFLNDMAEDLSVRQKSAVTKAAQERANAQPLLASLDTVVTGPFQGLIGSMGVVSDLADGDGLQTNGDYMNLSNESAAVRGAVANKIATETPLGKVGAFGYNMGMSMADSVARLAISAGNPEMSAFLAGSNAAVSTISSAKERGLSDSQAIGMGVIAGAAEVICERVSLGVLLDTDAIKDGALKYVIKNALAEGSEEVNTDLVNTVADILIAQDESEWQKAIDAYKEEGYDPNEAFARAFGDKAIEIGLSGLSGAISGGLMSGGTATVNTVAANQQASQLFGDKSSALLQAALDVDPENKYALKMLSKLEDGKTLTGNELRKLSEIVADARTSAAVDGLMQGIEPTQKVTPRVPTGSERIVSEMMDEVMPPKAKTPLEAALNAYKETGSVSNRQAEAVLNDPVALKTVLDATGTVLPDTASGKRAAVKEAIAELHQQQEQSIAVDNPADIAYDETGMTSPTTYGGYDYGAAVQAEPSASDRSGQAEILERQGGASAQDGNRPGVPHTESVGAAPAGFTGKQGYYDLLTDDNVQPARKTDVRPVEIPKTDGKGRKVSEFAHNAAGAQVTPDSAVDTIEDLVVEEALSFDTVTNRAMMENAQEYIKKNGGPKKTARDIGKRVFNGKVSGKDITAAQLLYAHYVNKSDAASQEMAQELLVDLATMANETGRNLQLFAMLRKLTPEGQLMTAQRMVQRSVDAINEGRSKKHQAQISVPQQLADDFVNACREAQSETGAASSFVAAALEGGFAEDASAAADRVMSPDGSDAASGLQTNDMAERVGRKVADTLSRKAKEQNTSVENILYQEIMRFANDKASLAKSGKKSKSGKNLQALQDYYRYRAFFQTAWDVARTRVQQTLSTMAADDPRREVLYSFLSSGGIMNDSPVAVTFDYGNPGSTIRRGTKEAAAAAGYRMENSSQTGSTALSTATPEVRQQLKDVLLENATDKEKAAQEIAAVAMQGLGLEGQAAEDMARDIVEAFYSDLADRAAKRLSRMFSTKQASQKVQNAFAQKLTELYNLGAFSNQDYRKMAFDLLFGKDADIEIPDSLMRQFVEAAEDRKGEALDAIYRSAASQIKATGWEKLNAWRYMAMLGNARTQIRNIGGNLLFRPSVTAKRVIGAGLERIFVKQENRTKAVLGAGKDARELLAWAREDAAGKTGKELLSFSSLTGDNARSKIQDYRQIYNTGWLEQVRRFVQATPEAADMFFKKREYSVALASFLKARGYTAADIADGKVSGKVLEEARAYAAQEAMKATFNDHNMLSDLLSKRLKGDNTFTKAINLAAEGVLPFRRTPANILVRGIEYNPVYLVRGIATAVQSVKNQEITAADAIDQLASSFTGTGMIILGWALASGVFGVRLRGKIEDEDEKAAGHQDYALEIGNTSFTVDWVAPANIPLLIGANIYEASRVEDPDATAISTIIEACGNALEPMLELSCLSSVNDLFESVKYSGDDNSIQTIAATIATSYLSQFIPTVFGQFERAVEKEKTSAYSDADTTMGRSAEKFVGRMAQKIPVGDVFQVKKYDERGEQDEMLTRVNGIGQFLGMPSNISPIQEDDIYKEISRLNSVQNTNVSLPKADSSFTFTDKNTVRHENYRLSAKEYETLSQTQGQTQAKLLHELFASSEYAALSDEQKAAAVKDVYNYARETARIAAVEGYPGYQNKWMIGIEDDPTQVIIDRQKDKAQTGQSKIAATGVSASTAAYVENLLDSIKPETGRPSVRTVQKWEALVDSDELSDSDVEKLLPLYMTGKTPERYKNALDEGFTSKEFVDAYRIYLDREEGTKKTQLIRQMSAELGVPYREAKQLYEIYTEDIA